MTTGNKRKALVTGATEGIGLACASALVRAGVQVLLVGRSTAKGERDMAAAPFAASDSRFYAADLAQADDLRRLFDEIDTRWGRLDIAINNAGIDGASFTPLTDYPDEAWHQVMALNLTGVYLCMKREIPLMMLSGGAIVNVASIAGLRASYTGGCAYTASKHGLLGLTKSAALEYARHGIRINAVCPGLVRTAMSEAVFGDKLDEHGDLHPLGRLCEADEVAAAALWLVSPAASFVTGVSLPVDGGIMAG